MIQPSPPTVRAEPVEARLAVAKSTEGRQRLDPDAREAATAGRAGTAASLARCVAASIASLMSRGYRVSARTVSVGLVLVLVAGTALVRGGVDLPVLAAAAVLAAGALALAPGRFRPSAVKVPALAFGLLGVVGVIGLQLVPLPAGLVGLVSPGTAEALDGALGPLGLWPSWRPLSLAPAATALELAKAAVLLAVVGTGAVLARSERRRDELLLGLAASGVLVSVAYYGAALLGVSPLLAPQVTFVNTNHLAGFFLLSAWPALGLALRSRGVARVGWLVAFAFVGSGVFLSLSRAGIAAFFVGAGVFAVLRLSRRRTGFAYAVHVDAENAAAHERAEPRSPRVPALPSPPAPAEPRSPRVRTLPSPPAPAGGEGQGEGGLAETGARRRGGSSIDRGATSRDRAPRGPALDGLAMRAATSRGGTSVAVAGVAGALAIASWLAFEPVVAELRTISGEDTTGAKLGVWPAAVSVVRDFPLAGIGRGAFATVYPAYKSEPAQLTFTHVENEWLQLPVDLGLVAGLAVVGLFAWAFLAAARRRDLSRPLAGALAGVAAVAAQNLFDFSLEIPGVAIPFALVLGLASRAMPRVEVRPWMVRAAALGFLVLAATGLSVHAAHPLDAGLDAVVRAPSADEAAARARAHLRWHPADYAPQAEVGARLAAEDRCAEALPWLTRAMLRNPTAPEPHRAAAACLARAGQHAHAKREYRLAHLYGDRSALAEAFLRYDAPGELLALAPETPGGLAAAAHLLRDRPVEAADAWRRAWELFGEPRVLASLAGATLGLGDEDEALRLARLLQERAPRLGAGYVVAARALDALGRGDEALAELDLGASRLPGDAEVLAPLGARHLAAKRYSLARTTFERIVAKEGPAMTRKRVLVARALEGQGRLQEALREAQVAREITPADLGAQETFARIAAAVGRYDEAIDALELAGRSPAAKAGAYEQRLAALRLAREELRTRRLVQGVGK
jgi:tetratricopeptide (TPR) repeat protein